MYTHGRGYTLIELLTVLAIVGLLIQFGLPGLNNLLTRSNRNLALQITIGTLDRARSMAVVRGENIGVCVFSNDQLCNADWAGDYLIVFIDSNKNRQRDRDEQIIYQQAWLAKGFQLRWGKNWRNEPIITYQPDGSVTSNGTLSIVDNKGNIIQSLIISKPGRVRLETSL
jgi:type IV fimbrial biogenesis protein FimT